MTQPMKVVTVTLNPAIDQTVMIPRFAAGSVNRVKDFRSDPGGKGVNAAAFLADYGVPVVATGFLGAENPRLFEHFFERKKITDRFVRITGSTRTGIKISDEINQQTTDINFPGQAPTKTDLEKLFATIDDLCAEDRWFVVAGSIPSGIPSGVYLDLIDAVVKKGGIVAVDASGKALWRSVTAAPALVKPNLFELQELCGQALDSRDDVVRAARRLLDTGLMTVVVSMGEEGALFVEEDEVVLAIPPRVRVKSTVGAGDAMLAGVIAGKIENRALMECARLATAFSVVAVTHIGAGLPERTAVAEIEYDVQLYSLEF